MKLDLSTSVCLLKGSEKRMQTLYSSQLYQTFFAVYGQFDYDASSKTLKSVTLKLINYKGIINLGIVDAKYNPIRKRIKVVENNIVKIINVISIKLKLRALVNKRLVKVPIDFTFPANDETYYIEIDRKLLPMIGTGTSGCDVFDTEFSYRDGLRAPEPIDREYRDANGYNRAINENDEEIDDEGNVLPQHEDDPAGRNPGGICPRGIGEIIRE